MHIQLRPSFNPRDASPSSASQSWNKKVNLNGYRCPKGTVPIRRTSREELIGAESFSKSIMLSHVRAPNEIIVQPPGQHVAIRQSINSTVEDPVIPYRGLKADVKIDNPSSVEKDQQSVAPTIFGDAGTHLFVLWRDGPENGCLNLQCTGFIQVSGSTYVGMRFEHVSEYGNPNMLAVTIFVHQDAKTGNWWLTVHGSETADVGYWPQEVVPYLRSGVQYVAWGGVVRFPPDTTKSPPMGNGQFPDGDITKVSAMWNLQYVDQNYNLQFPIDYFFHQTNVDKSDCYDLIYNDENWDPKWGFNFFFGGPGGDC
ncbi:hypothetical protein MKW92_000681 [Papaver armeniacum]|nr:hypothetical protein MKW92_000681 [Papaver armeniacum]